MSEGVAGSDADAASPDGLPPLREVIDQHDLSAKKTLGQNFLLDLNLTRRIARTATPLGHVVEIGPGPGGLTRALLLEGAERVTVIERDERCLAALEAIAARWPGRVEIMMEDALAIDYAQRFGGADAPAQIVANLPYNIGTALLVGWLGAGGADDAPWPSWWRRLTLMLQREVAERAAAAPRSAAYGRLALITQLRAEARILFDLSPRAFTPPPKVTSSILSVTPLPEPRHPCRLGALEAVTQAAFGQRRKMLRSSLKSLGVDPIALCAAAGLPPEARAETVDLAGFAGLARAFDAARGRQ